MRRLGVSVFVTVAVAAAACVGQSPPPRTPLPDVETAVAPPRPCVFVTGPGRGVLVDDVLTGTAADGNIEPGDHIVAIDDDEVGSAGDLRAALSARAVGDPIEVRVVRDGTTIDVPVVLGRGPGDEARPFLGVTIETLYGEVGPDAVPAGDGIDAPFSRLVLMEGRAVAVDPVGGRAVVVHPDPPPPPWYGVAGRLYRFEDGSVLDDRGETVPFDPGFTPSILLGSAGDLLLVGGSSTEDTPTIVAVRPGSGEVAWVRELDAGRGLPVGTIAAPDGTRILLGLSDPSSTGIAFEVVDTRDGTPTPETETLAVFEQGRAFGWFDPTTVIGQDGAGALLLLDVSTGDTVEASLPVAPNPGVRIWPVGDGVHVLILNGGTLSVGGLTPGVENRPLIRRCRIDYVDEVGSGRP